MNSSYVQGKIANPKIQKILKLWWYVEDNFFPAQIHSEGGEIDLWKSGYFPILCYNSWTVRDRKNVFRQKVLLLIRTISW